jgi:pimeloyl-ACP methyl ester carboxylesterase
LALEELTERVRGVLPKKTDFLLLAESFGGLIAAKLAADPPPNLRAMILSAAFPAPPVSLFTPFRWLVTPRLFQKRPPERVMNYLLADCPCEPAVREQIQESVQCVKPEVMAHRLRTILRTNVLSSYKRSTVPIFYLQASHDRLVSPRSWAKIYAVRPDARAEEINAPHFLLQCAPRPAVAAIERFLHQIEAKRLPL